MIERCRRGERWLAVLPILLALSVGVVDLQAQSISSARVSGNVRGSDGASLGQAVVTLSPTSGSDRYRVTTTSGGTFAIPVVQPGSYEVRIEALGHRPLVGRTLTLSGGDERTLSFTLTVEPPPVTRVDTVMLSGSASTRMRAGSMLFGRSELEGFPYRFSDLAGVSALATAFDPGLGSQGLPGELTTVFADGLPVYRAVHPAARAEAVPHALFPTSALSSVVSMHNATDVEWFGSGGGYVLATTRSAGPASGFEFDGAWSGDPIWSSSELDVDVPSLLSYQAGLRGALAIGDAATLTLAGEAFQHEAPLAPRVSESLAADLVGLDPALLDGLAQPGVESYRRYSGLARFDVQRSSATRIFLRGGGSRSERSFTGDGPLGLQGFAAPADESVDFSAAAGIVSSRSRSRTLELRAGVSGSDRSFGSGDALAPAYLADPVAVLGAAHASPGESSRTDFVLTPLLRFDMGTSSALKLGATVRATGHKMSHSWFSGGDAVYSGASELLAGQGFAQLTSAPEESFGSQELGFFAQYAGSPASNVRLVVGGRYDFERITGDGPVLNQDLLDDTGLRTDERDTGFHQFGARFSLGWDPAGTGQTRVTLGASIHHGDVDPRAIYETLAADTEATSTRYAGLMLGWPNEDISGLSATTLPTMTLMGPDARAPRTTNLSLLVSQRLGDGVSAFVGASSRRTDFLLRRRNLNLPVVPQAVDPGGRDVFGTLEQIGSTIVTTTDEARRFAEYGELWALDPDGWSEYRGVTAGLEYSASSVEAFGSYTWSETTDNWVGAASGAVGAMLAPGLPMVEGETPWAEGVSDFDRTHRAVGALTLHLGAVSTSVLYRFESGAPFTPGYRLGVDANGDGSMRNDVAFVPSGSEVDALAGEWSCLSDQIGGFAERNSCRGPNQQALDLRIELGLGELAGRRARITIDGLNLLESKQSIVDRALLLVDPNGSISSSPDGGTVTIPTVVNPDFGGSVYHTGRGRMIRFGVRVGG